MDIGIAEAAQHAFDSRRPGAAAIDVTSLMMEALRAPVIEFYETRFRERPQKFLDDAVHSWFSQETCD